MQLKLGAALAATAIIALSGTAHAQVSTYTDLASFQAAAGTTTLFDFDNNPAGTPATPPQILATPATGTFTTNLGEFTLAGDSLGDYFAIADGTNPGNINGTNFFYFSQRDPTTGSYTGDGQVGPTFTVTFSSAQTAFAFDWTDTGPTDAYQIALNDTAASVFNTPPFSTNGLASGFFGIVANPGTTFTTITFSQNAAGGVVDPFGVDNLRYTAGNITAAAAPEPTTVGFVASTLLGGVAFLRRRKRA